MARPARGLPARQARPIQYNGWSVGAGGLTGIPRAGAPRPRDPTRCFAMLLATLALASSVTLGPPARSDAAGEAHLLSYGLRLEVDPVGGAILGVAELELQAREGELEELVVALNRGLTLDSVTVGKRAGKPLKGSRVAEGQAWTIPLVPPLAKGKARTLRFVYHGDGVDPGPKEPDWMGVLLVREDEIRMSHQSQWYPIVPTDDAARTKLSAPTTLDLVLPMGFASLGPGELVEVVEEEGREVHRWRSRDPVLPSILAGDYIVQEVIAGAQTIRALSFPGHEDGARRFAQEAAQAVRTLERFYGDLGGRSYGLAEMRVRNRKRSYNYEADGFSVYDSVLFDGRDPDPKTIAHEVAHLWFGGQLDPSGEGERFLVESMAEAAALRYVQEEYGDAAEISAAERVAGRYFANPGDERSVLETDFGSPRYAQVIYGKGALALRSLRAWAGPEDYDEALYDYLRRCADGKAAANLESFLAAMKKALGDKVDDWEKDWLRRSGAPSYEIEFTTKRLGGGRTRVTGHLIQTPRNYRSSVELGLVSSSGQTAHIRVLPREGRSRFEAVVQQDVTEVVLDPRYYALCERD